MEKLSLPLAFPVIIQKGRSKQQSYTNRTEGAVQCVRGGLARNEFSSCWQRM